MAFMPFLGKAALAFAPSLLGGLFGGKDPGKQYRTRVNALLAPQNMGRLTQQYYQQTLGSPAYALGQRQAAQGANLTGNQFAQRAAMSGLGNTGIGAIMSSLTPSISGNLLSQLQAGAYQQAQGQAQNTIQQQIAALQGQMPATRNEGLFSAGLGAFGPLLQQYLQQLFSQQGKMPSLDYLQNAAGPIQPPQLRPWH